MESVFSIAALLVGGATVCKASLVNVFLGVVLFHMLYSFISPWQARLIGSAQLGEYFRVFVLNGVISTWPLFSMQSRQGRKTLDKVIQLRTEINW